VRENTFISCSLGAFIERSSTGMVMLTSSRRDSRFLPDEILGLFARVDGSPIAPTADRHPASPVPRVDISSRLREIWR
jgi:hypothetical protein